MKKPLCAARKSSGRPCKRIAGWGTDHYGLGHCREHDRLPAAVSQVLPPPSRIKALAQHFQQDKDPFDLREEIAITRATIAELLSEIDRDAELLRAAPALNMLLNTVGKLVQKLHEIEVGRRYVVRVDQVQHVLKQVLAVVIEHVPDPLARAAIADRIGALELDQVITKETMLTPSEQSLTKLISDHDSVSGEGSSA